MKKITFLLTFCFAFLAFSCGFSQSTKVGFQLGMSFSNMSMQHQEDEFENQRALIAPKLGFFVDIPVYEGFFISTGVSTSLKGFRFDGTRDIGDIELDDYETFESSEYFILLYLDFPLYFGYKHDFGSMKLYGKTGPYLDFAMYSTVLYKYDGSNWDNEKVNIGTPESIDDLLGWSMNNTDFGWNIETGIEFDRLQFSLFYSMGFSNTLELSDDFANLISLYGGEQPTWKNRVFGFNIGILFGQVDGGGRGRRGYRR
jgi:Outer membrane protein beta-barrel domain